MPQISVEFHALPSEVAEFARGAMLDLQLRAIVLRFNPFVVDEVDAGELAVAVAKAGLRAAQFAFTVGAPQVSGTS